MFNGESDGVSGAAFFFFQKADKAVGSGNKRLVSGVHTVLCVVFLQAGDGIGIVQKCAKSCSVLFTPEIALVAAGEQQMQADKGIGFFERKHRGSGERIKASGGAAVKIADTIGNQPPQGDIELEFERRNQFGR